MPRLDTEPFTMPTLELEDYAEIADTEADATEPERVRLPLRAATFTPAPELFPIRVDTWGEITHDTKTDPPQFLPEDTWLDDWTS